MPNRRLLALALVAVLLIVLAAVLPESVARWIALVALIALALWVLLLLRAAQHAASRGPPDDCSIPPRFWRRPDPYIYDQAYLWGLGLEITWDNPDVWFEHDGASVNDNLLPATDYEIVAALHNGSVEAPAFDTLVEFYVRDYGAGAVPQLIAVVGAPVIPVQGQPPATVRCPWTTPATGGHFCIVVRLRPVDDTNPHNNEGQNNV